MNLSDLCNVYDGESKVVVVAEQMVKRYAENYSWASNDRERNLDDVGARTALTVLFDCPILRQRYQTLYEELKGDE